MDRPNNSYYWARFLIHPLGQANGVPLDPDDESEIEIAGVPSVNEYHFHLVINNSKGQRYSIENATKQDMILVCQRDDVFNGEAMKKFPVQWLDNTGFRGWIIADEEELPE